MLLYYETSISISSPINNKLRITWITKLLEHQYKSQKHDEITSFQNDEIKFRITTANQRDQAMSKMFTLKLLLKDTKTNFTCSLLMFNIHIWSWDVGQMQGNKAVFMIFKKKIFRIVYGHILSTKVDDYNRNEPEFK